MNETDFAHLAAFAKESDYLKSASPRERVWYEREKQLIAEKFANSIEPKPIRIYRRKNARVIGRCCTNEIQLHNERGCTRRTLIHELLHAWLDKYKGYSKHHPTEFWELLRYLLHGGTVNSFYERIEKQTERIASCRIEKKSAAYKLASIEKRLKAWGTKQKRATTAIKKLERQKKRLLMKVSP